MDVDVTSTVDRNPTRQLVCCAMTDGDVPDQRLLNDQKRSHLRLTATQVVGRAAGDRRALDDILALGWVTLAKGGSRRRAA